MLNDKQRVAIEWAIQTSEEVSADRYDGTHLTWEYEQELRALLAAAPVSVDERQTQAARDVLAERARQVTAEGWTPKHDDGYAQSELVMAAVCYAYHAARGEASANIWPWLLERWKPTTPRRNLIKAGALILAEIERIDRAATTSTKDA
jgi:hypothetical protein